jgi:PAS domain S-box-containing protein
LLVPSLHRLDRTYSEYKQECFHKQRQHALVDSDKVHWVETIVTDMRDDNAINGIVCNSRVVTDRVENQLKSKVHLDRYNAVSKATSDAIWDLDIDSGNLIWNHAIKGVFGYQGIAFNYQWWYDRVHPDDIGNVKKIVDQSIVGKVPRWTCEYRFRCADGTYKYVLDRGFLVFNDHSGQPVRMIGAMQDISERVAYTKAVEEHNLRLKEIAWTQAHLVRAPLARILGLIPLLSEHQNDETTRRIVLTYLEASASDLDRIVRAVINRSQETQNTK